MSRLGKKPVIIPNGVEVKENQHLIEVKGAKGTLTLPLSYDLSIEIKENKIFIKKLGKTKKASAMWGTTARLLENMIKGVTEGFERKLELNGVGYRMAVKGNKLDLALGFSHPVEVEIPQDLKVQIEKNILTVSGIDKQKVGQFAAKIRDLKPVEPYKGKGFKYDDEIVRRKEGKKAVASE